jgi:hypothetical protein
MSSWSRIVALSAIAALVVCACRNKDDDEDEREHRKHRVNAGAVGTGSGGGVSFGCPFGLCSGGLDGAGPEHLCQRMSEIMAKETGPMKTPPPSAKDLAQCVAQMETMQKSQPREYAMMEKCMETAADMSALVQCMTKMYLDGGVP